MGGLVKAGQVLHCYRSAVLAVEIYKNDEQPLQMLLSLSQQAGLTVGAGLAIAIAELNFDIEGLLIASAHTALNPCKL